MKVKKTGEYQKGELTEIMLLLMSQIECNDKSFSVSETTLGTSGYSTCSMIHPKMVFILMSGLFTPIESMPPWAKGLTWLNPVAYMVELVLLKGSSLVDVLSKLSVLFGFGFVMNTLAIWNYRKRSG